MVLCNLDIARDSVPFGLPSVVLFASNGLPPDEKAPAKELVPRNAQFAQSYQSTFPSGSRILYGLWVLIPGLTIESMITSSIEGLGRLYKERRWVLFSTSIEQLARPL